MMINQHGAKPSSIEIRNPELVIAYLRYAVDDVRAISQRSAEILEMAIRAMIEDLRSSDLVIGEALTDEFNA